MALAREHDGEPLPRWFWTLPLLALSAWWPIEPFWASDDFLALHYAQHLGNAARDFVGPQYGATDLWLFWRPLITLSFWVDAGLGGGHPFVSHLSNVLAHATNTLLMGLLWSRWLPPRAAYAAALLWTIAPGHAGSIAWAVGRVDSHTTVWILATLLLFVRHCEGRQRRWPMLAAFVGALASKELAFVVPVVAAILGAALADGQAPGDRLRGARRAWPLWAVLVGCLAFRWLVLGRLGGYLAASYAPGPMAAGFAAIVADLVNPARWTSGDTLRAVLGHDPVWWPWLGWLPVALLAAGWLRRHRPAAPGAVLAVFLVACAPMAGFFAGADNQHSLRYFYLPMAALTGLFAAGGRWLPPLVLVLWLPSLIDIRSDQLRADRASAQMHAALRERARERPPAPMFVAGLPHAAGDIVQFHFGIDRMLRPPFDEHDVPLFALRPIADVPGVFALVPPGAVPFALPAGSTWWFADAALRPAPPQELPELPVAGDDPLVLDGRALDAMAQRQRQILLRTPGVRPQAYRLTIFTATGYLCSLVGNHTGPDDLDGGIDLLRYFGGDRAMGVPPAHVRHEPARFAPGDFFVLRGLEVPTTIDLVPEFPVLLEAGTVDGNLQFTATHRARRLLRWRFDRGFPAFVRRVLGLE